MKVKVQMIIESENNSSPVVEEITSLQREDLTPETLGLTLEEAKDVLASLQSTMVNEQVSESKSNADVRTVTKRNQQKDTIKLSIERFSASCLSKVEGCIPAGASKKWSKASVHSPNS